MSKYLGSFEIQILGHSIVIIAFFIRSVMEGNGGSLEHRVNQISKGNRELPNIIFQLKGRNRVIV